MNMKEAIQSTEQSLEQIISTARAVSSDLLNWKPAEDKWSILEVLAHVDEAIPYWLDEINRLLEQPGAEWGRGIQDPRRLAALEQVHNRTLDEVLASIEKSKGQIHLVLGPITEANLNQEAPSRNPRFGTKPLSFVIQHLLVEHADIHDKQIKRNIEQYNAAAN